MSEKAPQQPQQVNRPSPMQSLQLATIDAVEMLSNGTLTAMALVSYMQISFTYGTQDALARMKPPAPAPSPGPISVEVKQEGTETPN